MNESFPFKIFFKEKKSKLGNTDHQKVVLDDQSWL